MFLVLPVIWHVHCYVKGNERSACSFITKIKALQFTKGALE